MAFDCSFRVDASVEIVQHGNPLFDDTLSENVVPFSFALMGLSLAKRRDKSTEDNMFNKK